MENMRWVVQRIQAWLILQQWPQIRAKKPGFFLAFSDRRCGGLFSRFAFATGNFPRQAVNQMAILPGEQYALRPGYNNARALAKVGHIIGFFEATQINHSLVNVVMWAAVFDNLRAEFGCASHLSCSRQ